VVRARASRRPSSRRSRAALIAPVARALIAPVAGPRPSLAKRPFDKSSSQTKTHYDRSADGGTSALSNLMLLWRRHHGLVHDRGGFQLDLHDGVSVFRRPDGTVLDDRAPP
jgi:hypothetical protein